MPQAMCYLEIKRWPGATATQEYPLSPLRTSNLQKMHTGTYRKLLNV